MPGNLKLKIFIEASGGLSAAFMYTEETIRKRRSSAIEKKERMFLWNIMGIYIKATSNEF